jgi:sugar/nucleoside kinase (ribokinase family)
MTTQPTSQPDAGKRQPQTCVIVGHATIDEIVFGHGEPAEVLGGAAAYAACGAAQAGGQVSLVTLTGPDYDFAPLVRSVADRTEGTLDISGSRVGPAGTIRNRGWYGGPEDRRWAVLDWDAMVAMSPGWDAVATVVPSAASLVVCPTPVPIAAELASHAARCLGTVIVDTEVHYLSGPEKARQLIERARCGAILMPSWVHLPALFGISADNPDDEILRQVTRRCAEAGVDLLVIKRGVAGSVVIDARARSWTTIPAARRPFVVDPTGAGDVFDGGFAVTMSRTGDPVEASCWGAMAASFAVEHQGATVPPHFCRAEAAARLRAIRLGASRQNHGPAGTLS